MMEGGRLRVLMAIWMMMILLLVGLVVPIAEGGVREEQQLREHYQQAIKAFQGGNLQQAGEHFETCLGLNPGLMQTYLDYGVVLERQGREEEARKLYQKATARFSNSLEPLRALCRLSFREFQGNMKGELARMNAEFSCQMLVSQGKKKVPGDLLILGTFYTHVERHAEGLALLHLAHTLTRTHSQATFPEKHDLLRLYTQALYRNGSCPLALEVARDLVARDPGRLSRCNLGHMLASCSPRSVEAVEALAACNLCSEETGECDVRVLDPSLCGRQTFVACGREWDKCQATNVQEVHVVPTDVEARYGRREGPLRIARLEAGWKGKGEGKGKGKGKGEEEEEEEEEEKMPLEYNEKRVYWVRLANVYLSGEAGFLQGDCAMFMGGHAFNSKVPEAVSPLENTLEVDVPAFSMISQTHNNYYHFMAENLPRLLLSLKHLPASDKLRVVVPGDNRFILETVQLLGLGDRLLIHHPQKLGRLYFRTLYWLDWAQLQHGHPAQIHQYEPWAIYQPPRIGFEAVREALLPLATLSPPLRPQILYVGRGDLKLSRHVVGEEDLLRELRGRYPAHDVISVSGSKMTLLEQVGTFKHAALVIGAHGAGLSNIMFCAPGTPVVYFPMEPNVDSNFGHMAMAVNLSFWMVPSVSSSFHGQYHLNPSLIRDILDTVLAALPPSPPRSEL